MVVPHSLQLFAATPPGLEDVTAQELRTLGTDGIKPVAGGVEFEGDVSTLYSVNLWSRTAQRILVRLDDFYVVHLAKLHKKLQHIPWESYLDPTRPIEVKATCRKSRIYHSAAAAERGARAIQERLGLQNLPEFGAGAPREDSEANGVVLRFERDHCTVSLDSSGAHLHRRGYRIGRYDAPIRENLAAALLLACGFNGETDFWDPMCGSGTFPIEAAMMAANIAPGMNRPFAFMQWPGFDKPLWASLLRKARESIRQPESVIGGSDINPSAVSMSRAHAKAAGVSEQTRFDTVAVDALRIPAKGGLVLANPPYGKRIGNRKQLNRLYRQLGAMTSRHGSAWQLGVVTNEPGFATATGLDIHPSGLPFPNGGVRVRLYRTAS